MTTLFSSNPHQSEETIGLIPAGGSATRLGQLPCSKEIYPVGFEPDPTDGKMRPKMAATRLLESMRLAGVKRGFFILRQGKWDIPSYYGDGKSVDIHLAYLMMDLPYGVPYTLDQAYPFIRNKTILFGFPDILFRPENAFVKLLERKIRSDAPIVLGIYKADTPSKMDMLKVDDKGRVRDIVIKPAKTTLTYTWIVAAWDGRFSRFQHEYVKADAQARAVSADDSNRAELYLGDVIRAAVKKNWLVETVFFESGVYLDVGTPEDMQKTISDFCWI